MSTARVDHLMDRYLDATTVEAAESALHELAALDAEDPSLAESHEPIGDLYGELAEDFYEHDEYEPAVQLQTKALEHPCTNLVRERGILLGYRFAAGDRTAVIAELGELRTAMEEAVEADLAAVRAHVAEAGEGDRDGDPTDGITALTAQAHLVGAFGEAVERVDAPLALSMHDEAVALAAEAADEDVLAVVRVPRALLRRDMGQAPDADDIEAFRELESLGQRLAADPDAEAIQLFLPRDQLALARTTWPEGTEELGMADADAFYRELELFWREWPTAGGELVLRPLTVALLQEHGSSPMQPADEMPEALVEALEARDDGLAWPPGRNDACWCGSERKYKKCCGAA